jgi:hypothetical protein
MSAMSDVLAGVKKMLLIEETVARIDKDMDGLRTDLRELRSGQAHLSGRLSDVEGYLRAATRTPFGEKPRLEGQ